MKYIPLPSQERLKELLDYDPETGVFTYKVRVARRVKIGDEAGYVNTVGYRIMSIDGRKYAGHRMAWIYKYGEDPIGLDIDHKDGDRTNNRIDNLRLATRSQNTTHRKKVKGIRSRCPGKWEARIKVNGKEIQLGNFTCPWHAYAAYWDARYKYFGEFA